MLSENIKHIISNFTLFSSWEDKYEHLISLGESIPQLKKTYKTDDYLIRGCQSRVWLACECLNGKLYFYGDSDALITKGILALIIKLYSKSSPNEILNHDIGLFTQIGLIEHLSMNRANGLNLMIQTVKNCATKHNSK